MSLRSISLQNFRSYKKSSFDFSPKTTLIIGPNTLGKTNIIEAIFLLSTGKSFKGRDEDMIKFGEEVGRVKTASNAAASDLEVVLSTLQGRFSKRYFVNGVPRRRADFVGHLPSVLFTPVDLELITDGPGVRRRYLDFVLEQTDREYAYAAFSYEKALRARNRLLEQAKKTRRYAQEVFAYWDAMLIAQAEIITKKREEYLDFVNSARKDVFKISLVYDKNVMSEEQLESYREREIESGMTLVGPHRDDFQVFMEGMREVKVFGSRGQQRLGVLQLKIIELQFAEKNLATKPLLLLDDIFSELDQRHIELVMDMVSNQQTVITTTHREFVGKKLKKSTGVIELE